MSRRWQPDSGDDVGDFGHGSSSAVGTGIERVARGQYGDDPAGSAEGERFEDEVIVDRVPGSVVALVVQCHLAERDVADDEIERAVGQRCRFEPLGPDRGLRVEQPGDLCSHGIEFDAGPVDVEIVWREADEVPGAAARLEDSSSVEAE